jgi:hypothetical protein
MTTSKAKKVLVAGLCAATLGGTLVTTVSPAEAQWRRPGYGQPYYRNYRRGPSGGAIAAGVVGGLALGALAARLCGSGGPRLRRSCVWLWRRASLRGRLL